MKSILGLFLLLFASVCVSGEVSIVFAKFKQRDAGWQVDVTLKHADTGWDHYANAWRIIDESGKELARRVLAHPHVDEQPFTRSLYSVKIPEKTAVVIIEGSDTVHGWSSQRVRVDLSKTSGEFYQLQ